MNRSLREAGLHPFIEVRAGGKSSGLVDPRVQQALSFDFWLGGVRIAGHSLRAGVDATGTVLFLQGTLPEMVVESPQGALTLLEDWPPFEPVLEVVGATLAPGIHKDDEVNGLASSVSVHRQERVFVPGASGLQPVWRVEVAVKGLPYVVFADQREVLSFAPAFFDLTASANVYAMNKADGTLSDLSFLVTDGQSNLVNTWFRSVQAYPDESPASISGGRFDFAPSSAQFREANVFAHVNRQLDFLKDHGYQWTSASAIRLRVGECVGKECACVAGQSCSQKSNALYIPSDVDFDAPAIRIAEGDGVNLKDLHFDAGVVGHELGHHVVVATVTDYGGGGEPLSLHEGLSDFFVMMRQDSPCMGRGICTNGGRTCYTSICLRTADNDLTYGSDDYAAATAHQKGQLISGMLWDLKEAGIATADLVRLVLGAVDLLPSAASFGDFGVALLVADANLFNGTYRIHLEQASLARGLDRSSRTLSVADPLVIAESEAPATNMWGCTVGASPSSGLGLDVFMLILLALPSMPALRRLSRRATRTLSCE